MSIASINPATGETIKLFTPLTDREVGLRLQRAAATWETYHHTDFAARAVWMQRAADILEAEKHDLGRLLTLEMGKTLASAIAEVEKCALGCRYYADKAAHHLADEHIKTDARNSYVKYQPLGVVLAVMPWNFPFWQVFRFAAPALMAGNVALLKHASNVPQCALAIEDVLRRAGFPEGVFQTLLIGADQVPGVLKDPRVRAATLTGSEPAGSRVASLAGRLIKPTVLELGGSDPFIVMPSADLTAAVTTAVKARCVNNGQSCIAAKRFIVHEEIYEEFAAQFVAQMDALVVGDPLDEATDIGPLATDAILEELADQVERAVAAGAKILTGGVHLKRAGNFYAPTVLADITADSPVYYEEMFGPVAMLFRARDAADAVRLANDSPFGLGASVWTNDTAEQQFFIEEIAAGQVFVNAMVASTPALPFGGIKQSGYGRELGAPGIRAFVNAKSVWIGK